MKKHLLYLCTILFLTSCIAGIERDISISSDEDAEISVEQAREFFEQELLSLDNDRQTPHGLSPGDFTPKWDAAQISQNREIACVDVPIIPRFSYRAIMSEYKLGKATAYIVKVSQKLVIVKNLETCDMAQYIMSIIPDKDFGTKHKGDISNIILSANDKGKFSGIILYTHNGTPVTVNRYIDGVYADGATTYGVKDELQRNTNFRKIIKIISGIKFKKNTGINSRTGEDGSEDEEDEEDEEWWNFEEPPFGQKDPIDEEIIDEVPEIGDGGSDNADKIALVKNYITAIMLGLDDKVANIRGICKFGNSIKRSGIKACIFLPQNSIYDKDADISCAVIIGLNEVQTSLAVAHAGMHLTLIEISRNAGSAEALYNRNSRLSELIEDTNINQGHHEYMALHIDEFKQLLRDVFPRQSEEYYEYGVWGYGLTETKAFERLPLETKNEIDFYITKNSIR